MQFMTNMIGDNKVLLWILGAAALLLAALILVLLYRLLFGRRLRGGGGRARQPRLGVVDAYDLDRHRQLVIVRRDNIEHLVMIGGPNDVLIESAIVRSAAAAQEPRTVREAAAMAAGSYQDEIEPIESVRPAAQVVAGKSAVLEEKAQDVRSLESRDSGQDYASARSSTPRPPIPPSQPLPAPSSPAPPSQQPSFRPSVETQPRPATPASQPPVKPFSASSSSASAQQTLRSPAIPPSRPGAQGLSPSRPPLGSTTPAGAPANLSAAPSRLAPTLQGPGTPGASPEPSARYAPAPPVSSPAAPAQVSAPPLAPPGALAPRVNPPPPAGGEIPDGSAADMSSQPAPAADPLDALEEEMKKLLGR